LPVLAQTVDSTRLQLPLSEREVQLIVFSPGQPVTQRASVAKGEVIPVSGDWEFELYPVLDNRFGDYHWPPTPTRIGAEVRQLEYSATGATNGPWQRVTCSFGPQFWKLGPLPDNFDETQLVGLKFVDPAVPVEFDGKHYRWEPYEFSWRWGKEGDPGHQGYHGLKGEVTDHFLCLGAPTKGKNETVYAREREGSRYYLWTSVPVDQPTGAYPRWGGLEPKACWVNHQRADHKVQLQPGANPVLVRYDQPGRGFFVVDRSAPKAGAAAAEEVFSAAARWIWYPSERTDAERWFFRAFTLDSLPAQARLRITCDNSYTVSLNGHPVGHGSEWTRVQEYEVAKSLRPGRNELAVCAVNTGDSAGLIAELRADNLVLATDDTWLASKTATGVEVAAESQGTFRDSGWFKHQLGPPKLAGSGQFSKPVFERKPLAMTWWTNTSILPFDVYPQSAKAVGWYRFTAPPGLKGLRSKARGNLRIWADGQEMRSEGNGRFDLTTPASAPARVLLQVESERGAYGGAALPEYLQLDCRPGPIALGDWAEIDGLLSYSGGAWYRRTVTLPAATEVILDLGDLVSTAELVVNGQPAGIRVAPPWTFDITKLVRPGENRLEVMIRNTLGNHYTSIPTAYRGSTRAGLLGPVKLELR
jgi:hypothetical protein